MSTAPEERDWWEGKAADLATARRAIWDEPEPWRERLPACVDLIAVGLGPVLTQDARILDLGCGIGDVTRAMAERYPSVRFVGVDVSPKMLDLARSLGGENTRWVKGDGRTLPRVGKLAAAWSLLLFQHIPAEAQRGYIAEVSARLEPGGIFRFQWVEGEDAAFLTHQTHEEQARAWCEEAGLKVEAVDPGGIYDVWRWTTAVKP